jgi:hypothetical protein
MHIVMLWVVATPASSPTERGTQMLELELDKAELKTVNGHRYYIFPSPIPHQNWDNRPLEYADEKVLKTYRGKGSNNGATLHPDVLTPAGVFMTALLEYGDKIDDWSIRSAVIQNGYRADNASQGANYLRIIKSTIAENPTLFKDLKFPAELEADAQSVLGRPGDPRRVAFRKKLAESKGWSANLVYSLFQEVDKYYSPRGSNPHATGFVFDLDFSIYCNGTELVKDLAQRCKNNEITLGADKRLNGYALTSAAGMWINKYANQFSFDSYDTGAEVWHLEYRKRK